MVVFYAGLRHLFAWAIPYRGQTAVAATPIRYDELAAEVTRLRRGLNPQADTLAQIPEFDVALAYRLYQQLLQPVETGWHDAATLIVVPHRIVGELPLSVLVTMPVAPISKDPIRFSGYRSVPRPATGGRTAPVGGGARHFAVGLGGKRGAKVLSVWRSLVQRSGSATRGDR